ncbi:MAG: adenylate kinase [Desulfobacterota bacterium]|nr:adenylate kinase [Thermodesulfobacteriota bacterium]
MRIILLGSPGAGKGTVANLLKQHDGSVHISTGDILRNAVKAGTPLGKKAKEYMDQGALVPDSLIIDIMGERLQESDCKHGFILDGFPRTIPQAEALDNLLEKLSIRLDGVVNLEVARSVILDRLTTRRTCSNPSCQAIYNVKTNPPKTEGICDKCGSPVVQRSDETEEAILKRLETYNQQTAPLIDYYKKRGMLITITSLDLDTIIKEILAALKK